MASPDSTVTAAPKPFWPLPMPTTDGGRTVLLLVVAMFLLAARQPGQVWHPQFWAEDGAVFFADQYRYGTVAMLRPSSGYSHLIPRMIAAVASCAPLAWVPVLYVLASLAVTLGVVALLQRSRFPLPYRTAAALLPLLVPTDGEVYLNPTNLQWLTTVALAVLLLQPPPAMDASSSTGLVWRWQIALELVAIAAFGLTGPFVIGFLPFLALRFWLYRGTQRHNLAIVGVAVLAAGVQLLALATSPSVTAGRSLNPHPGVWLEAVAQVYPACLFGGEDLPMVLPGVLWYVFSVALTVFLIVAVVRTPARRIMMGLFLSLSAVALGMAYVRTLSHPLSIHPFVGGRYFVIPYTFTLLAIWALLDHPTRWIRRTACGLLLASLLGSLLSFVTTPRDDQRWAEHVRAWEAGNRAPIPINPPGWSVRLE